VLNADYWSHNEYGAYGRLVVRYESFDEWDPETGTRRSGWHKYDDLGRLLGVGEGLGMHEN